MRHDLRSCAEHTCAESRGAAWPRCRPVREKLSESGNSPHGLQVRPRLAAGGWSHDAARRDRASSPGLRGPIINSRCQNGNTGSAAIRTRLGRRARRRPRSPRSAPGAARDRIGPRTYNMPGYREVVRCARCGHLITADITADSCCPKCGTELHACVQCAHFDTGQRFQCVQAIAVRVSPKDARNTCSLFESQRRFERETGSTASGPPSARQAFDDLFK